MRVNKIKNDKLIIVENWSDTVIIKDLKTNKTIATSKCADHIKAVLIAKAL
jgi:hypothetical protein